MFTLTSSGKLSRWQGWRRDRQTSNHSPMSSGQLAWWSGHEHPRKLANQAKCRLWKVSYFSSLNNDRVQYQYSCMQARIRVRMCVCTYVRIRVYVWTCVRVCTCVRVYICTYVRIRMYAMYNIILYVYRYTEVQKYSWIHEGKQSCTYISAAFALANLNRPWHWLCAHWSACLFEAVGPVRATTIYFPLAPRGASVFFFF